MGGGAKVGIVAVQGDVRAHAECLDALGANAVLIRTPGQLAGVDAVVIPGGESTTMSLLLDTSGLEPVLADRLAEGMPALGTCAGMILLAAEVADGRPDQRSFGAIDVGVRRNGFGRQVDSFETELDVTDLAGGPLRAVFIRAPVVERVGPGVEVLAAVGERPVLCRQGPVLVAAFHPELAGDLRLHARFLQSI